MPHPNDPLKNVGSRSVQKWRFLKTDLTHDFTRGLAHKLLYRESLRYKTERFSLDKFADSRQYHN